MKIPGGNLYRCQVNIVINTRFSKEGNETSNVIEFESENEIVNVWSR